MIRKLIKKVLSFWDKIQARGQMNGPTDKQKGQMNRQDKTNKEGRQTGESINGQTNGKTE